MGESSPAVTASGHPGVPLVAKAICRFSHDATRTLFATELSLRGAFILAMQPPTPGEELSLELFPTGLDPLPTLRARVVESTLDANRPERTGFRVVFINEERAVLDPLFQALIALGPIRDSAEALRLAPAPQRRVHPRVDTTYRATVPTLGGEVAVHVLNLSLGGALLDFGSKGPTVLPGMQLPLKISSPVEARLVEVQAVVVRVASGTEQGSVGVRFFEVTPEQRSSLEQLMLHALTTAPGRRY